MTLDNAYHWVAFAMRQPISAVRSMGLDEKQVKTLGKWAANNPLLNPPAPEMKTGYFICQCGCNQKFFATYRTAKPKYVNNTHKMRAYRARKAAKG